LITELVFEGWSENAIDLAPDGKSVGALPVPFDIACAVAFDASVSEIIDLLIDRQRISGSCRHIVLCPSLSRRQR
jgi:hypothetical protein